MTKHYRKPSHSLTKENRFQLSRSRRQIKRPETIIKSREEFSVSKDVRENALALVCVASVSVQFRRKERGTRVKDREKSGSRFISHAVKTESPLPRYFFAPKPNGNACYAG